MTDIRHLAVRALVRNPPKIHLSTDRRSLYSKGLQQEFGLRSRPKDLEQIREHFGRDGDHEFEDEKQANFQEQLPDEAARKVINLYESITYGSIPCDAKYLPLLVGVDVTDYGRSDKTQSSVLSTGNSVVVHRFGIC